MHLPSFSRFLSRIIGALLVALLIGGCTTPTPRERPRGIDRLEKTAREAAAIYLCIIDPDYGPVRLRIVEVWRHDPRLGPAPEPGTRIETSNFEAAANPAVTGALAFVYDPPRKLANGTTQTTAADLIYDGTIREFGLTVDAAAKVIRRLEAPK